MAEFDYIIKIILIIAFAVAALLVIFFLRNVLFEKFDYIKGLFSNIF